MADAKALVERMFDEIINKGNLNVADELFAEDFLDHGPMGDVQGREAFKALVSAWRSAVPDVHCDVSHVFAEGDYVGWVVHTTGTHTGDGLGFPATGKRIDTISANVGRLRNGLAAEHWSEQGLLTMLQQIGVIPALSAAPA
jgi:predicted ester cyclase